MVYNIGDIITFNYGAPKAKDPSPIVLVIAPLYEGKMHGVNLKYLPDKEREMLLRIANPDYHSKIGDYVLRFPALQKVLNKRKEDPEMMGSKVFYTKYVGGFANRYNCYRQYRPQFMMNVNKIDLNKFKT